MNRPHYLRPVVCREAGWSFKDTLLTIAIIISLIGLFALVQWNDERTLRLEREAQLAEQRSREVYPGVRIVADEGRFVCSPPTRIRLEWADAIGRDCEKLARAMYAARATE